MGTSDLGRSEILGLFIVGAMWGCTDPLLKVGAEGISEMGDRKGQGVVSSFLAEMKHLFLNWKYVVPFAVNQLGSLVYTYMLGQTELSVAVPVANSLKFVFALLTGVALGEPLPSFKAFVGMAFVMLGTAVCLHAKQYDSGSV